MIISDGGGYHTRYTADEIESGSREADVQIYAMGVFDQVFSLRLSPYRQPNGRPGVCGGRLQ